MQKKRVLYFDVLNILACIAVISLHHNGVVHTYSNSWTWKTALLVETGAYWAVPVFLMLSGATLMNYRKNYDTVTFFKKRFSRAVIPFFCWSGIVLIWKLMTDQFSFDAISIKAVINTMLNYKMENVYWYFPLLFSIYLFMPVISRLADRRYRNTLWYSVGVMFICQSTIVPLTKLCGIQWNGNYGLPINSYIIFVFLGYLLSTSDFKKTTRYKIYAAGILGWIIRYAAIYVLSTHDGEKNKLFFNYGYFPSVMLACAVFVLIKAINWEKIYERLHINAGTAAKISSYSLGIYLTHRIIMYYELKVLGLFGITNSSVIWRTLFIFVTYMIAMFFVALLKKIPLVERIVP